MRSLPGLLATTAAALVLAAQPAVAQGQPSQAQIDALNRQIQALQSQLETLRESVEKQIQAVDKRTADMPTVTVNAGRPRIVSADKAFDVALRTRFHIDYGNWFPDSGIATDLPDGFNVRRAFLGVAGTVYRDWAFEFTLDASGSRGSSTRLQAANIAYTGIPGWRFEIGLMQPPFTLDDATGSNDIPFIERSAITNTITNIVASESRAAVGVRKTGSNYMVAAYLTGDQAAISPVGGDDQLAAIGRGAFLVHSAQNQEVAIGASAGTVITPRQGTGPGAARPYLFADRPENRIGGGTLLVSGGTLDLEDYTVWGGDIGASFNNFWAAAEYYAQDVETRDSPATVADEGADLSFEGYYVSLGYILTGEHRKYNIGTGGWSGVVPSAPFNSQGGIGAWELGVRYSVNDLQDPDYVTPLEGKQTVWTFGVNWYVNAAIRFMLNYQMIDIERPAPLVDADADAIIGRLQFQF
ncbi:porin [Rhodocista pekingensis]|uniref:Porin n=1 Tax=Rhodocista pekingensis TaxID=201185 RepID=A0ABW2KY17_9PROT